MYYILTAGEKIVTVNMGDIIPIEGIEVTKDIAEMIIHDEDFIWSYQNETVVGTPIVKVPPEIAVVSIRQARKALHQLNYLNSIEAYMSVYASEDEKIDWEWAIEVKRNHPLVESMRLILNVTKEDIDNLFTLASTL